MSDLSPRRGPDAAVRLPATLPQDAFTAARTAARDRLLATGLPGRRDEYWRFTDPAPFNAVTPPALDAAEGDSTLFDGFDKLTLVFVDGRFDAAASDPLALDGVEITPLAEAAPGWATELYGTLEEAGQVAVKRPFGALNSAAAPDGLAIRVTGRPGKLIHILHRRRDQAADALWHHLVRVEPGAEATIVESGEAGARQNGLIEADVAKGGRLHLISAKRAGAPETSLAQLFARVAEGAALKAFALAIGGNTMRRESFIDMVGDDALVHVAGACLGGEGFHHDDTIFIAHSALRGESRQVYKKVLTRGATGVFQGKILVRPGAQKTDGYQISQSLLLDDRSQFLAKPELEIYADDVKCSHGSTTGALDETSLFYLRSRGVPEEQAVVLLVLSFLAEALAEIEDESLRERITTRLGQVLEGGLHPLVA